MLRKEASRGRSSKGDKLSAKKTMSNWAAQQCYGWKDRCSYLYSVFLFVGCCSWVWGQLNSLTPVVLSLSVSYNRVFMSMEIEEQRNWQQKSKGAVRQIQAEMKNEDFDLCYNSVPPVSRAMFRQEFNSGLQGPVARSWAWEFWKRRLPFQVYCCVTSAK